MNYINIGKIINTHGIKGELKILPLTDDVYRFDDLKTVYLGDNKLKVKLKSVKYQKNMVIIKFKEFNNINEVLTFKNEYIYIDECNRVDLSEGHYFIFDIIGCIVFDNNNNNKIGIITDVIQSAGNDVYVVKDEVKNKEYLIPAVKEFIIHIDIENKKIIIDPIEGMIE